MVEQLTRVPRVPVDATGVEDSTETIVFGEEHKRAIQARLVKLGLVSPEEELSFLTEPDKHEGSDALYFLDLRKGNDRILVQVMQGGERPQFSSRHCHPDLLVEEYHPIEGTLFLSQNGVVSPVADVVRVEPGVVHQAQTHGEAALTLLVMKNAYLYPRDKQHIPAEQP